MATNPHVPVRLDEFQMVALAALAGLKVETIVDVYEGVMVRDPERFVYDYEAMQGVTIPPSDPYPTVEILTRRKSGRIDAHRYVYATVAEMLASAAPASQADAAA